MKYFVGEGVIARAHANVDRDHWGLVGHIVAVTDDCYIVKFMDCRCRKAAAPDCGTWSEEYLVPCGVPLLGLPETKSPQPESRWRFISEFQTDPPTT